MQRCTVDCTGVAIAIAMNRFNAMRHQWKSIKIFSSDELRILVFEIVTDCRDMMHATRYLSLSHSIFLLFVLGFLCCCTSFHTLSMECEISLQAPQLALSTAQLVVWLRSLSLYVDTRGQI